MATCHFQPWTALVNPFCYRPFQNICITSCQHILSRAHAPMGCAEPKVHRRNLQALKIWMYEIRWNHETSETVLPNKNSDFSPAHFTSYGQATRPFITWVDPGRTEGSAGPPGARVGFGANPDTPTLSFKISADMALNLKKEPGCGWRTSEIDSW